MTDPSASTHGSKSWSLAGTRIGRGERRVVDIPLPATAALGSCALRAIVIRGIHEGPRIWLSGAVHGDELNGIEIVRRAARGIDPNELSGTVIAVPVVNVYGVTTGSRYMPDRRDLNRCFPGSAGGSLGARVARIFMRRIVRHCSLGMDFHCGSDSRTNAPQIRADLDEPETARLARSFSADFSIHAPIRGATLREAALEIGVRMLLFEGGQAGRFEPEIIGVGIRGALNVLDALGMHAKESSSISHDRGQLHAQARGPVEIRSTSWVRADHSGFLIRSVENGARVELGQPLGVIRDTAGYVQAKLTAPKSGHIIGLRLNPVVREGDAVFHIGRENNEEPS